MVTIIFAVIFFIAAFAMIYPFMFKVEFKGRISYGLYYMICLVTASVCVHIICACLFTGHSYDTSCFRAWASRLADGGFKPFYSSDSFNNYPPGYMYVLRILGMINQKAHLNKEGFNMLLKIPPMLADIALGIFIYIFSSKRNSEKLSVIIAALWLLNPAAIINSALWGQTDVVYSFLIVLMLYYIAEEKLIWSYFMFALAILVKPQTFILTPVLICGIADQVFVRGFDKKKFFINLGLGLAAICFMLALCLPFGIADVFRQYTETLQGNPYFTQNAFNLWGMLGKNYAWITAGGSIAGYVLIGASVAFVVFVFFKAEGKARVYFCGGLLMLCTYMLSVKMNERYAFTVIPCFLMAFAQGHKRSDGILSGLITLSQFFNMAWVLFVFETDFHKYYPSKWICLYSAFNMLMFAYAVYTAAVGYAGVGKKLSARKKIKRS